jgi:hypothetical protein
VSQYVAKMNQWVCLYIQEEKHMAHGKILLIERKINVELEMLFVP